MIFLTVFVIATTLILLFFAYGMVRIGQQNDRFASEPTALATVKRIPAAISSKKPAGKPIYPSPPLKAK